MNDHRIRALLDDAVADVEPRDRLAAIRARTRPSRRRLWVPAGAALVAASVVAAVALGGRPGDDVVRPEPADTPTGTVSPSPTPSSPTASTSTDEAHSVAVYYVGDTPDGPRLYREFRRLVGDPLEVGVAAAVGRATDGRPLSPLDPDYRVPWPALTDATATLSSEGDVIEVSLSGDPQDTLHDRGPLTEGEATMAVEQLVYTAQAAVGERLPVRFLLFGNVTDQVLGVPTSEPLGEGPVLDTLAHVSLTEPSEGQLVDNDDPFTVTGVGNSFEGNIVTRIQRWEGTYVVDQKPATAGWGEDRLFPWQVTFDLTDVPPGDYVVISSTDDPSGQGRFHTDTRRITVVD